MKCCKVYEFWFIYIDYETGLGLEIGFETKIFRFRYVPFSNTKGRCQKIIGVSVSILLSKSEVSIILICSSTYNTEQVTNFLLGSNYVFALIF